MARSPSGARIKSASQKQSEAFHSTRTNLQNLDLAAIDPSLLEGTGEKPALPDLPKSFFTRGHDLDVSQKLLEMLKTNKDDTQKSLALARAAVDAQPTQFSLDTAEGLIEKIGTAYADEANKVITLAKEGTLGQAKMLNVDASRAPVLEKHAKPRRRHGVPDLALHACTTVVNFHSLISYIFDNVLDKERGFSSAKVSLK